MEDQLIQVLPAEVAQIAENVSIEKRNEVQSVLNQVFNGVSKMREQLDSVAVADENDKVNMKLANTIRLGVRQVRLDAEKTFDAKRAEVQQQMLSYKTEDQLWLKAKQTMQILTKEIEEQARWKEETKQRFEAERKAEEERIAKEKAEAEERARIKAENERLKLEAEAKEKQLAEERAKAEAERKEIEAKAAKLKAEADAKLKAEKEANEKLQAEIRAKAEAEEKAKRDAEIKAAAELKAKQQAEAKAAKAPIKQQLNTWVDSFSIGKPISQNETTIEIEEKFEAFKKWAKLKIESL